MDHFVGRGVDGLPSMGDSLEYMNLVRFFRGEVPMSVLNTPFAYRPAIPLLAAWLPVRDPMTALNCINLACLALSLFFLHGFLRAAGYTFWKSFTGDGLYVVSFPVFYYGTIGLVDSAWMAILAGGLFCLYRQQWMGLCAVILLGTLVRETTIWLLPVVGTYLWIARPAGRWTILAAAVAAYMLSAIAVRVAFTDLPHYVWHPSLGYFSRNFRLRVVGSMALSFGIPGFLALWWLCRRDLRKRAGSLCIMAPMLVGMAGGVGLSAFAILAAYADGRFLWGSSLFSMPFCLDVLATWWRRWREITDHP